MPGPICSLPSFFTSLKEILSKCTFSGYNLLNLQNMLNSNMLGMLHVAGYLSRYLVTSIKFCQISSTQPDSTWLVIGSHLISRIQPNPMVGYPVNLKSVSPLQLTHTLLLLITSDGIQLHIPYLML